MTGPAFAAAALRLLKDPARLARVGEGARRLYAEHLSWERIADRLLADRSVVTRVLVSHPHVAAVSLGLADALAAEGKAGRVRDRGGLSRGERRPDGRRPRWRSRWPVLRNRILPGPASDAPAQPDRGRAGRAADRARAGARPRGRALALRRAVRDPRSAPTSLARWPRDTTAVYAYEDGALRTFERAARLGIERVWDLPAASSSTIEQTFRDEESSLAGRSDRPAAPGARLEATPQGRRAGAGDADFRRVDLHPADRSSGSSGTRRWR